MEGEMSTLKQGDSNSDLRLRGSTTVGLSDTLTGTIHPFLSSNKSMIGAMVREMGSLMRERAAKRILAVTLMNMTCTVILLVWCSTTNSMALTAYTYLTIYDIFSLLTCMVSIWVRKQKQSPIFSFGYERFEVLAVFVSTILAQLGALFIIKESTERMVQQPEVHTGRLLIGTTLAFFFHMAVTYGIENKAFNHVILASSSSWLQEHVADMSESLCHLIPGLSKLLLPRINPFSLIAFAGATALGVTYIVIDINNYFAADTWAAVWIAVMTFGTMFPMSVYSGKILLQTTPSHMIGQLDKCIREASTLDGVLEFRHEHFWTLAFGTMGGTVHVRIRRDADEQMVLAHVSNRLSNLVSVLTVQIFKDDWTRSSSFQVIGENSYTAKPSAVANNINSASSQWHNHSHDNHGHSHSHSHGHSHTATAAKVSNGLPGMNPLGKVPAAGATLSASSVPWMNPRTSFPGTQNSAPPSGPYYNSVYRTASPTLGASLSSVRPNYSSSRTTASNTYTSPGSGITAAGSVFSMQGTLGGSASFGMKAMQFNQEKFQ